MTPCGEHFHAEPEKDTRRLAPLISTPDRWHWCRCRPIILTSKASSDLAFACLGVLCVGCACSEAGEAVFGGILLVSARERAGERGLVLEDGDEASIVDFDCCLLSDSLVSSMILTLLSPLISSTS